MRNYFRPIVTGVLMLTVLVAMFAVMLFAAFCVPQSIIEQHRLESIDILHQEGYWPNPLYHSKYVLDNFTDERHIFNEIGPSDLNPLQRAFSIYPRYWNGHVLFTRMLLIFGNINLIRQVQSSILIVLLVVACYAVAKRVNITFALAMLLAFIPSRLDYIGVSLQYGHVYIPMLIMIIWVSWHRRDIEKICYGFLVVGAVTSYLDLLTFPILTLLIPLLIDMVIRLREEPRRNFATIMKNVVVPGVLWTIGYAVTWMMKWLLSTLITGANVFADAASQASLRSQGEVEGVHASFLRTLGLNIRQFVSRADAIVIGSCVLAYVVWTVISRLTASAHQSLSDGVEKVEQRSSFIKQLLLIIVVGYGVPLLWYAALTQHTTVHYWMTYRNLTPVLFATLIVLWLVVESHFERREQRNGKSIVEE